MFPTLRHNAEETFLTFTFLLVCSTMACLERIPWFINWENGERLKCAQRREVKGKWHVVVTILPAVPLRGPRSPGLALCSASNLYLARSCEG